MPTSDMIRWRLYRLISSADSPGSASAGLALSDPGIAGVEGDPPATDGMMLTVSPAFSGVCSFCKYRMSSSLT